MRDAPSRILLVRRSNDTLDSDELLDAGTPPPSYAEVLACISTPAVNELDENSTVTGIVSWLMNEYEVHFTSQFCIIMLF